MSTVPVLFAGGPMHGRTFDLPAEQVVVGHVGEFDGQIPSKLALPGMPIGRKATARYQFVHLESPVAAIWVAVFCGLFRNGKPINMDGSPRLGVVAPSENGHAEVAAESDQP